MHLLIFFLIYCDMWGPYKVNTHSNDKYFLTFLDDYSRAIWIFLMVEKSEVKFILPHFLKLSKRNSKLPLKMRVLIMDENFICLRGFFLENGITHQTTILCTPQQNGQVECMHRYILNVVLTLLF